MPKSSATVRPKPPLYWNAKQNENRWQSMKGKIAAIEKHAPSLTGDFVPDYLRNCDVLSIAPHPHLLPPSSEEKAVEPNDDDANTRFGVDGNASNGNHGDGGAKNENSRNVPDEKEEGAADTADAPTYDDTEIRVTGWKLDEGTANAIAMSLPYARDIVTLRTWNASVSASSIATLADAIEDSTIQKLYLDYNAIETEEEEEEEEEDKTPMQTALDAEETKTAHHSVHQKSTPGIGRTKRPSSRSKLGTASSSHSLSHPAPPVAEFNILHHALTSAPDALLKASKLPSPFTCLLTPASPLQLISLRACGITSRESVHLFAALQECNSVISLNLWGNNIGDEACSAIANYLLTDKTLLSLSLAHNCISSKGALELVDAMRAKLIDKDASKELKKEGYLTSNTKSAYFRDANASLRMLNLSHNKINDEGCSVLLGVLDKFAGSGEKAEEEDGNIDDGNNGNSGNSHSIASAPSPSSFSRSLPSSSSMTRGMTGRRSVATSQISRGGKSSKKDPEPCGKGNVLEKVYLAHNPFSQQMHEKLMNNMQAAELGKVHVQSLTKPISLYDIIARKHQQKSKGEGEGTDLDQQAGSANAVENGDVSAAATTVAATGDEAPAAENRADISRDNQVSADTVSGLSCSSNTGDKNNPNPQVSTEPKQSPVANSRRRRMSRRR